jgi:putative membrane protein insertion efficiency factor
MKTVALGIIHFYQRYVSAALPPSCRFEPTCSHYGEKAIERYGFWHGGLLALKRLGRCHPFYNGNLYDPVP